MRPKEFKEKTMPMALTMSQISDVIGWMRKYNRSAHATRSLLDVI